MKLPLQAVEAELATELACEEAALLAATLDELDWPDTTDEALLADETLADDADEAADVALPAEAPCEDAAEAELPPSLPLPPPPPPHAASTSVPSSTLPNTIPFIPAP